MSFIKLEPVDSFSSPDRKRGSDQFLELDSEFAEKRKKFNDAPPSKVLHIRNLPDSASEGDVIALGVRFGRIVNILKITKGKGRPQAFLEMEDISKAEEMVKYYEYSPAKINGTNVYVQFSSHKELKIEKQSPTIANLLTAAALATSGGLGLPSSGDSSNSFGNALNNGDGLLPNPSAPNNSHEGPSNSNVLRVVVDNMLYPVSIDALNLIFSKYGAVIKIVICTKTNQFQVFVQYADNVPAKAARSALDGQNIYNGCCTMKIGFSKYNNLNVKYNNDKTRDFSRPDLPSGEGQPSFDPNLGLSAIGAVLSNPFLAASAAAATVPNLGLLGAGNMLQGIGTSNSGMQGPGPGPGDDRRSRGRDYDDRAGKTVLLVSELNAERIKCDDLFTLFGAYGDVMRVKILFHKPNTALIQFADPQHAQTARENLNEIRFQGNKIRVSTSKHDGISMPKKDGEGEHLTKDYSRSPAHRFKQYGSKNYQNIFPPARVLHLSNIPGNVTEEDIRSLFSSKTEGKLTHFEFFTKEIARGKKMALVEMGSVEEAVQALVDLHDYPIGDDSHLRISFSKKTIRP
ncbi:polypyrimidine tract-binding protein 1-like isoform X2 [Dendronephthya gigantea]|uniref:polypyrimidine tract-binding protein 1-like isoform X2 n=1 Tax=Dendronephthya gigantea TaxID=151771 RepID=UPI00106D9FAB|nr:polypyrimidine tract-binding protein 1-like isoform X2 [Dendronephthya gigantea]